MISINKKFGMLGLAVMLFAIILPSCNKDLPEAVPIKTPVPTGNSITKTINTDANFTILKAALTKAGTNLSTLLNDSTKVFTFFAPDDAAFIASGIPSAAAVTAGFRAGQLDTLIKYHLIGGQAYTSANIPGNFPNLYLQSSFVLQAPSAALPPGLRMPLFVGKAGTAYFANNIPVTQADIVVSNGVIHKVARVVLPPSQFLWNRIDADADLTYLKAAINRADEGTAAASTLRAALLNPAANLTLFAPSNVAFQQLLTGQITVALIPIVTQQLINGGATPADAALQAPAIAQAQATALASTPDVFTNPALATVLTPTTVKGLVVYHILGIRSFSVNIPTTATAVPTLLNTAIAAHPGVIIQSTFGPAGVTAATVKGAANPTASNIAINPTPAPGGTSDQHYINGVIHKINQVLRPQ